MIFHKSFEYADLVLNKYFLSTANNFFFRKLTFFCQIIELVEKGHKNSIWETNIM